MWQMHRPLSDFQQLADDRVQSRSAEGAASSVCNPDESGVERNLAGALKPS